VNGEGGEEINTKNCNISTTVGTLQWPYLCKQPHSYSSKNSLAILNLMAKFAPLAGCNFRSLAMEIVKIPDSEIGVCKSYGALI
jgi:hypothetical protein